MSQRFSPRNIYSNPSSPLVSPKTYSSLRPLSPDALELKRENEELKKLIYQLNIKLEYEQKKSRSLEYRELLRKELKSNVLSIRDPIKRRQMIHEANEDEIREGKYTDTFMVSIDKQPQKTIFQFIAIDQGEIKVIDEQGQTFFTRIQKN